ncbi:MAG TPA: PHP domain-containing protein [Acidimicrobiia bacterium]|jgi:predicted metal-dependent phosphoesterase TrpH|nr:PHP domain-containing protein [Acidimicrobiia bacterium]
MKTDLHTHSTASDGSDSPGRVVELAAKAGLGTVALTDHDTQEGLPEAGQAADRVGIELIPGVELSLQFDTGGMHLLVLWLPPGPGPLQDRLQTLQDGRGSRNERIVELLTEAGMPVTIEEIREEAGGGSVGRPHIAAVMMKHGYVPDIRTAFDEWLGAGKPAYVGRLRLDPEEAIGLARESGAVPVLAHPHTLGITTAPAMADVLTRLCKAGLIGLEAIYSSYHAHERAGYADLAGRFGLAVSGGSDYHGTYKPGLMLGTGYGDLVVPGEVVEKLRTHAGT